MTRHFIWPWSIDSGIQEADSKHNSIISNQEDVAAWDYRESVLDDSRSLLTAIGRRGMSLFTGKVWSMSKFATKNIWAGL